MSHGKELRFIDYTPRGMGTHGKVRSSSNMWSDMCSLRVLQELGGDRSKEATGEPVRQLPWSLVRDKGPRVGGRQYALLHSLCQTAWESLES